MSGKNAKPMSARPVATASVLRHKRIVVAPLPVEVDHHAAGDDEVQRSVEVVAADDQPAVSERPVLYRLLVEDPESALQRDQVLRVLERLGGVPVVEVPDRRVDDIEGEDREDLDPPIEVVAVAETSTARELATPGTLGFEERVVVLFLDDTHGWIVGPAIAASGGAPSCSSVSSGSRLP